MVTATPETPPPTAAPTPAPPVPPGAAPRRLRRLGAATVDLVALWIATIGVLVVANIYLLGRTSIGRYDVGDIDSLIAVTLEASIVPVWIAWQVMSVAATGATAGQRLLGLRVEALPSAHAGARYLRMALHPISAPAWLWLALMIWLAGAPRTLSLTPVLAAGAVVAAGIASGVVVLARPRGARAIHDILARTCIIDGRAAHG